MAVQAVVQKVGFFSMMQGIYGTIAAFASALQRVANAADNLGQWAEESTAVFADEARLEREDKIEAILSKRAERQQAKLAAPQPITDVVAKEAA